MTSEQGRTGAIFGDDLRTLSASVEEWNQKHEKKLFAYLEKPTKKGYADSVKQFQVQGFDTPCPICGEKEPWQEEDLLYKADAASEIGVNRNLLASFEAAKAALAEALASADEIQKDSGKADGIRQQAQAEQKRIEDLRFSLENSLLAERMRNLSEQRDRLNENIKKAGLFSKEKKQWNAQLNDCEAELAETQTKLDEERQQTELEIFVCEQKRSELLALLKHFTGRVWFAEKETTMALALAEEGEQCPDAVEIGLQPFLKIRDVKVSPHEKDNTAALTGVAEALKPLMEEE